MAQPCEWTALVALVTRTLIATTYLDWHLVVDDIAVRLGFVTIHPTRGARRRSGCRQVGGRQWSP